MSKLCFGDHVTVLNDLFYDYGGGTLVCSRISACNIPFVVINDLAISITSRQ
jgi:hypothetical protein